MRACHQNSGLAERCDLPLSFAHPLLPHHPRMSDPPSNVPTRSWQHLFKKQNSTSHKNTPWTLRSAMPVPVQAFAVSFNESPILTSALCSKYADLLIFIERILLQVIGILSFLTPSSTLNDSSTLKGPTWSNSYRIGPILALFENWVLQNLMVDHHFLSFSHVPNLHSSSL